MIGRLPPPGSSSGTIRDFDVRDFDVPNPHWIREVPPCFAYRLLAESSSSEIWLFSQKRRPPPGAASFGFGLGIAEGMPHPTRVWVARQQHF